MTSNVVITTTTTKTTTVIPSIVTIVPQSLSPMIIKTTTSLYLNTTVAPYACDELSLACLAYKPYCAREIEFNGTPCRVMCPRTCETCNY